MTNEMGQTWVVVLAGGEGSRLRSLTTTAAGMTVPKQFCSLYGGRSLLQEALAVGHPEVVDPSTQEPVELLDLLFHAHAVVSRSELPHTILEALDALGMNRYVLRVNDKAQKRHTPVYVRDVRLLSVHREF